MRFSVVLLALAPAIAIAQPGGPVASSQSVALLPLDAGKTLELYGQPVASELARAMASGNIDVQIVGPRMSVPAAARLIIDGTIKTGTGEAILLSIRVRNPADGTVFDTLSATASSLSNIDKAAADLASRVVPVVRARLAVLDQKPATPVEPTPALPQPPATAATPVDLALTVTGDQTLRAALGPAVHTAGERTHHQIRDVEPAALNGERGARIAIDITSYKVVTGTVPTARARVRLFVAGTGEPFDRVLFTDTIVGDKGMSSEALAARVAEEVLTIARPYVKRVVRTWQ